jgi:hypothetical protein
MKKEKEKLKKERMKERHGSQRKKEVIVDKIIGRSSRASID